MSYQNDISITHEKHKDSIPPLDFSKLKGVPSQLDDSNVVGELCQALQDKSSLDISHVPKDGAQDKSLYADDEVDLMPC